MKKVLLSVGVLIENDRDCIEKCLQCVEKLRKGIVCELVVGNLGATDGSREVAEKYADQIIDLFWNGSICDAWNTILDHCTGEWYFGIEADECLDACLEPLHNCLKEAESLNAISVAIQEAGAVQWGEVGEQTKRENTRWRLKCSFSIVKTVKGSIPGASYTTKSRSPSGKFVFVAVDPWQMIFAVGHRRDTSCLNLLILMRRRCRS